MCHIETVLDRASTPHFLVALVFSWFYISLVFLKSFRKTKGRNLIFNPKIQFNTKISKGIIMAAFICNRD